MSGRPAETVVLSRRIDPSAVAALFGMGVTRLVRGRRLLVLAALFSLPAVLAALGQRYDPEYDPETVEQVLVFGLIPQTLLPLTALVFASGMVQDEVEEQTLTYLLIRPLPRPAVYLTKLAATSGVMAALASAFTALTELVVYWPDPDAWSTLLPGRVPRTVALMLLSLASYAALFGLVSLFLRRSLVLGVGYIILFEGVFANVEFVVRKLTIMYYFRVLTIRWIGLDPEDWGIDLDLAPTASWAALDLALSSAGFAVVGAIAFARREFRVKTPEAT